MFFEVKLTIIKVYITYTLFVIRSICNMIFIKSLITICILRYYVLVWLVVVRCLRFINKQLCFVSDSSESGSNKCSGRTGSDGPGNSRLGSAGKGSSDGKPTRVRTVLNEKQLHTLRTCYSANPRPDALMKEQLVEMTGLSPRVIRVWFQNKRCKDKKRAIALKQQIQQDKVCTHRITCKLNTLKLRRGCTYI
jgi:hypothetical protein